MTWAQTVSAGEHIEERARVMRKNRLVLAVCGLLAAVAVAVAGALLLPRLHAQRVQLELVNGASFRNMPPSVTLPSALMSTFRGLAIHFLWSRAEELKQESKYYELQQLTDWICELEPRYPKVWENSAWNMSYNISVGTFSPNERWHWVSAGAYLLRDKGIPLNPRSIELYKELSWIYLHKMGDFLDDHHWTYKKHWAVIMERVLGQPPPEPTDEEVIGAMRVIADAARGIRAFGPLEQATSLQLYIDHDTAKPAMSGAVARLAELSYLPDRGLLEDVARYHRSGLQSADLRSEGTDEKVARFRALLADPNFAGALERLLAAVRAQVLQKELRLDAEFMLELMQKYGPLDWRNVHSHGLYWAALGTRECKGVVGLDENVEMNTYRFIQFALKNTCYAGRLIFEPNFDDPIASYLDLLPDYRFAEAAHQAILEQAERVRAGEDPKVYYAPGPAGRLYKDGHVNFLQRAVSELYLGGRVSEAQRYYDYLRANYFEPDGRVKEMYQLPLEEFVLRDFFEDLDSYKSVQVIVHNLLHSSYMYMAALLPAGAKRRFQLAEFGYNRYMQDKQGDRLDRRKLKPWPQLVCESFEDFILRVPLPVHMRARAWHGMDNDTKLEIYRRVEEGLGALCANNDPPFSVETAFPPPEGLAEFEARRQAEKPKGEGESDEPRIEDVGINEGGKR